MSAWAISWAGYGTDTMKKLTVDAWAKLNLTLDVGEKRPDCYHNMEMIMQSVSLHDKVDITLTRGKEIKVMSTKPELPTDLHNLAGKAAKAFLNYVNYTDTGVEVYITKEIPDRAGMAGGSADAAAVIRGLDELLKTRLSEAEMLDICASVGSDVPFCLLGGTALARGRGEILTPLPPMPDCGILIVKPDFSVSTPALFDALDDCHVTARPDTQGAVDALRRGDLKALCANMVNVFEEALPEAERRTVVDIKSALISAGALGACMTGTGSAVFGVFQSLEAAKQADLSRFGITFAVSPQKAVISE